MNEVVEARVREILSTIVDPHTGQDLVSGSALRGVGVADGRVSVDIQLGYPALSWQAALAAEVKATLEADAMIESAAVSVSCRVGAHRVQEGLTPMPNIRNVIAVASGKGARDPAIRRLPAASR